MSPVCLRPAAKPTAGVSLPVTAVANASTRVQPHRHRDKYALIQARQKRLANLKRQEDLKKERAAVLGDPVRGITTPFVASFDKIASAPVLDPNPLNNSAEGTKVSGAAAATPLNHFITPADLETSLQHSFILTQPIISTNRDVQDPAQEAEDIKRHEEGHKRAAAAIARIVSLANGNQKDRKRVNIKRCIEAFGRHNTDAVLKSRAPSQQPRIPEKTSQIEKTPRAGPDTGSPEVQIAVLTAKIRVLANHLAGKGKGDKINKRNLRVLVHKRQKLLNYLRKKERGGDRWQYVISTLGLTDGTWKGEISL